MAVTLGPDDKVIALMGMTGVGKSSFIQLFTPESVGVGEDLESFTSQVAVFPCQMPNSNEKFYLVDTPGFDDSNRPDQEILREVSSWLTKTYADNIKLSGIIYLHRIMDVKFTGAAVRNLSMFKKLCGDGNLASVVLATTFWSKVDPDTGNTRENQLKTTPTFWGTMVNRGSQVFRHDSAEKSGAAIVQYLLDRRQKPVYTIQDEMVNEKKTLEETAAGTEVQTETDKVIRKYEQTIADLKQEIAEATQTHNEAMRQELEREKREHEEFIRKIQQEQEKMKVGDYALWQQREMEREQERQENKHRMEALMEQISHMAKADGDRQQKVAELEKQLGIERMKYQTLQRSKFSVRFKTMLEEIGDFFRTL
ncbi:uncharacterized protein Z518_01208 [Rhinocladiella mackenziei CBS 650.93]|uniref:G domain-containing protein n=1 Tax=Rhinocladiella mackenziei CBS 650.93 TaxID=1442369 RepID=A0A0D2G5J6_9EURO|nr:uncharacterized protein Z518_01208 [Rhinocladiella mackenziei CBS 650.93]KIX10127.1 hypothetical protein Z518_01208 [Rhinocladiella mackenziei CBS 650.93]